MAITKQQKQAQVTQLLDDLGKAKLTVMANYHGLSVEQMQQLRKLLKAEDSNIRVIKNTLIQRAVDQYAPFKAVDKVIFDGPMALVFGYKDEAAPAQVVGNFAKAHPQIEFIGAINAAGEFLDAEQTTRLSQLLSKEQLLAQLVGTIAAPISGFVRVLGGNMRGIVQVLAQYREQRAQ